MTEDEKRIVEWLRNPIIVENPTITGNIFARLRLAFDWVFRPRLAMMIGLFVAANAVERGDHRKD